MENQHRHIKGYRELSTEEIALMNEVKAKSQEIGELIQKLRQQLPAFAGVEVIEIESHAMEIMTGDGFEAQRWLQIGEDHLQQGFMAVTRAIARPTTF